MKDDAKQRILLTIALGLTFFVILQYIMPPPPEPPRVDSRPKPSASTSAPKADQPVPVAISDFAPVADYEVVVRIGEAAPGSHAYEASFSSVGAGLSRYRLLGYNRSPGKNHPENDEVILLDRISPGRDSMLVSTEGMKGSQGTGGLSGGLRYQLVAAPQGAKITPAPGDDVSIGGDALVFRAVAAGWEVTKTYTFAGEGKLNDFSIGLDVAWRNVAGAEQRLAYHLTGPTGMLPDDDSNSLGIIYFLTARQPDPKLTTVEVERKALSEVVGKNPMNIPDNRANLAWFGAKNRFFAALVAAKSVTGSYGVDRMAIPGDRDMVPTAKDIQENLKNQPKVTLESGPMPVFEETALSVEAGLVPVNGVYKASYVFYGGPADDTLLEASDPRFSNVISYTMVSYFDTISRWLVSLLTILDKFIGNYGLAIIILTLLVRAILHPLNRKSLVSMNKMQKLAPMMKEIQKKYANDKVKMQQEVSRLYRENGVSMAGGCLPMFIQLPIFFALYGAFSQGFSIRHAVFIPGWIDDLSKPDSVYNLGWNIPLFNSSHISLLPILYLGLQFLQMSLQPKPTDPQQQQQQRIMKIMPLMFVFIFYAMPAGLVLYFAVSALFGVLENWWMRNVLLPKLGLGGPAAAGAGVGQPQTAKAAVRAGTGVGADGSAGKGDKKKKKK